MKRRSPRVRERVAVGLARSLVADKQVRQEIERRRKQAQTEASTDVRHPRD